MSRSIWLEDAARGKPKSADFHGFDISLDQVGPKPWLPANIRMHTWNLFEEPPEEFVGYFDVVHVRLITVVVRDNDPRPVLASLTKLLSKSIISFWLDVCSWWKGLVLTLGNPNRTWRVSAVG